MSRSKAVDFTTTIGLPGYYVVVVPLKLHDNVFSVAAPLTYTVWICLLISIPIFIVVMSITNYLYSGYFTWEASAGYVMRTALADKSSQLPDKHLYKKLLAMVWTWVMLVIIIAYSANLIAIITRPTLNVPFKNVEEMINQKEITWAAWDKDLFTQYAQGNSPGTVLRNMIDRAIFLTNEEEWADECYTTKTKKSRSVAAICDVNSAKYLALEDFGKSGTCNYYLTQDKFLSIDNVLAFQVGKSLAKKLESH